ncbi:MAG: anion permease [Chloroflexi bacterium]|nr:anion permease [Chloroflexota bacterium]
MISPPLLALLILAAALLLLLGGRFRPDLIAILVLLVLGITGLVTPQQALAGFSSPAVVAVGGIFVISAALARTGAADRLGTALLRTSGSQEGKLVAAIALAGGFLSLFMQTIGVVAILLPPVAGVARRAGINLSKLLIPLSFGSLLGGMATLFTTPNLLVSEILATQGLQPFSFQDFAAIGLPTAALGITVLALLGPRFLPERAAEEKLPISLRLRRQLTEIYRLQERVLEVRILPESPLAGQSIAAGQVGEAMGLHILAIIRNGSTIIAPPKWQILQAQDLLLVEGKLEDIQQFLEPQKLEVEAEVEVPRRALESMDIGIVEATLAPRSALAGKTLKEINFREKYGFNVLALWRGGGPRRTRLSEVALQMGDALLLQGPWEKIWLLQRDPDFLVLEGMAFPPRREKAGWAVGITSLALFLVLLGFLPLSLASLLAAALLVLSGCLSTEEAYQAIDWRTLVLIAGLLPLGTAIQESGAADLLTSTLVTPLRWGGPFLVLAGLFSLALLLTQGMGGAATAVLLAPLAISWARDLGSDPHGMAMAVALAASCGFLTPISHPANLLIMGPGNYRLGDYARVGALLAVMVGAVILILVSIFWPLR